MATLKPRIVQAADAVAYLPLYAAETRRYALKLDAKRSLSWTDAFDEPFRSPPAEHLEHIKGEARRTGDQGCLNAIVSAWTKKRLPLIGICDPINVARVHQNSLVIVGALINRACFWCLTDDLTSAKAVEDLAVDALFIHESSFETGHGIGLAVDRRVPRGAHGEPDRMEGSFELLVDGAVWWKEANPDRKVAAISASVLSCVIAKERKGFKIAFPLHDTEPYRNFLTTGIVVHREALHDEDVRNALKLLILSLQKCQEDVAMMKESTADEIVSLARTRFENERKIECARVEGTKVVETKQCDEMAVVTKEHAKEVWELLTRRPIYSEDCRIRPDEWTNAFRSRQLTPPPLDGSYDESIIREAEEVQLEGGRPNGKGGDRGGANWTSRAVAIALIAAAVGLIYARYPNYAVSTTLAAALVTLGWPTVRAWRWLSVPGLLRGGAVLLAVAWVLAVTVALVAGLTSDNGQVQSLTEEWPSFVRTPWNLLAPRINASFDALSAVLTPVTAFAFGVLGVRLRNSRSRRLAPIRKALGLEGPL